MLDGSCAIRIGVERSQPWWACRSCARSVTIVEIDAAKPLVTDRWHPPPLQYTTCLSSPYDCCCGWLSISSRHRRKDAQRFGVITAAFLLLVPLLWSPYVIGQTIIFLPCDFYLSFFLLPSFFSSPNLSGRRLDVYHTSTHGVALVRI